MNFAEETQQNNKTATTRENERTTQSGDCCQSGLLSSWSATATCRWIPMGSRVDWGWGACALGEGPSGDHSTSATSTRRTGKAKCAAEPRLADRYFCWLLPLCVCPRCRLAAGRRIPGVSLAHAAATEKKRIRGNSSELDSLLAHRSVLSPRFGPLCAASESSLVATGETGPAPVASNGLFALSVRANKPEMIRDSEQRKCRMMINKKFICREGGNIMENWETWGTQLT